MTFLPINIELKTEEEQELFKWCWQNFEPLNQARKVRIGRIILDVDVFGKIKAKYEISQKGFEFLLKKTTTTTKQNDK